MGARFANLSIGRKIVGLSVVVLSLMLASAIYTFFQSARVHAIGHELVATLEPLSHEIAMIESHEIEQALLVERTLRHVGPQLRDTAAGADEAARSRALGKDVDARIAAAERLVRSGMASAERAEVSVGLSQIEVQLDEVRREHRAYDAAAAALLATATGDPDLARREAAFVAGEDRVTAALERLNARATALAAGDETRLGKLEDRQFLVSTENLVVALLAFLAGTLLSALLTRRMLRPVHGLIAGTEQVALGNFEVDLPATGDDEIGRLTRAFGAMASELRSKAVLRETFGSYVDPRVVDRLLGDGREALEAGERREMAVLFVDLEGFTSISETLTATALVKLVNRYLTLASAPISAHGGVIDKYIGDAVMAFWGAPFSEGDCALAACRAALDQQPQLDTLRGELPELLGLRRGAPAIKLRIGVATGDVVVGSIGSRFARSFTVIGDAVNLASRLEGANKLYGTSLLVDEVTAARVGDAIAMREIDLLAVAGKDESVRVFELFGPRDTLAPERLALAEAFERALAHYRARGWDRAQAGFEEALRIAPGDSPSRVFLDRIARFRVDPPGSDWAGVWRNFIK